MTECPTPDKKRYPSKAKANRANRHRRPPPGVPKEPLYPYLCDVGDHWHLTRQTPEQQRQIAARIRGNQEAHSGA